MILSFYKCTYIFNYSFFPGMLAVPKAFLCLPISSTNWFHFAVCGFILQYIPSSIAKLFSCPFSIFSSAFKSPDLFASALSETIFQVPSAANLVYCKDGKSDIWKGGYIQNKTDNGKLNNASLPS